MVLDPPFQFDASRQALCFELPNGTGRIMGIPVPALAKILNPDGTPFWKFTEADLRRELPRFARPSLIASAGGVLNGAKRVR